jgi:hypothetical protein
VWLAVVLIGSSGVCLYTASQIGATFDEPFYIRAGLTAWRTGSNKLLMRAGTMPLPVDVQTLPVYLWERWRGQQFSLPEELPIVLPVARAANLVFWWLLLFEVWRLAGCWGGRWGSRLAVLFVATEPNLLAHAMLATTDIAATACLLLFWDLLAYNHRPNWWWRVLLPGLGWGLALTAKASALVFGLYGMAVFGLWQLLRTWQPSASWHLTALSARQGQKQLIQLWRQSAGLRRDSGAIIIIGLIAAFGYTGCDWGPEPTFIRWAEQLPEGPLRHVMLPLSQNLTIFTNAGEALLYQIKHNIRGHDTYICGQWYHRAVPWYFPLALTMKMPLSVAALFLLALTTGARRLLFSPWTILALLIIALSPTYRVQIGIRFLFPAMVLLITLAAATLGCLWNPSMASSPNQPKYSRHVRGGVALVLAAIVSVHCGDVYRHWPHWLAYFNAAWGGPAAPNHLLHESNYDWGQGLPELRRWCQQQGIQQVAVWYYGTDPAVDHPPFCRAGLSHLPHGGDPQRILALCGQAQWLAVSIGCLRCNPDITPAHRHALNWFKQQTPYYQTRFFLIYSLQCHTAFASGSLPNS